MIDFKLQLVGILFNKKYYAALAYWINFSHMILYFEESTENRPKIFVLLLEYPFSLKQGGYFEKGN